MKTLEITVDGYIKRNLLRMDVNMKNLIKITQMCCILVIFIFSSQVVLAEELGTKRGLVTSSQCPYSCKDTDIPLEFCRDYQLGTTCRVEDLRMEPGHRTLIRTKNTSKKSVISNGIKTRRDIDGTWITLPVSN